MGEIVAVQSLAVKYRPQSFDDVTEQGSVKVILKQQLESGTTKNAYLFCGGAGTGKTTCARIFANEINKGQGNPIEMDAASNNGVDDVRDIIDQAKKQSLDSEYKVFIIDECHMISNAGWNAMLKLIEEPPAKSIFIFCTTDPQKIPKTILSRVQRYDFTRISHKGIVDRLGYILYSEGIMNEYNIKNLESGCDYIAKIADGGMRDAITLMDKCLAFSDNLTLENVVKAIGTTDYDMMFDLNDYIFDKKMADMLQVINEIYMSGRDLKQFIKLYMSFILDICKYAVTESYEFIQIPQTYDDVLSQYGDYEYSICHKLLSTLIQLNADIKWETSPRVTVESTLMLICMREDDE